MTFLLILHVLICLFMVFVILLQPGKGDGGIGFGSSSQSIFGSKGAGNFLTKTTSVCAILFLVTSFILTRSRMQEYNSSVIKDVPSKEAPKEPVASPGGPTLPNTLDPKKEAPTAKAEPVKPQGSQPAPKK